MDSANLELLQKRIVAGAMDYILFASCAGIVSMPLHLVFGAMSPAFHFLSGLVLIFLGILYLLKDGPTFFIPYLQGQSPGKKAIGLIPTKVDGKTNITWKDSIMRNAPLSIGFFLAAFMSFLMIVPFIGGNLIFLLGMLLMIVNLGIIVFEIFLMYKDPEMRRWGDKLARTKVVPYD